MPIGFGIVGCGMISHFHAPAIADIRGARLVACFDSRPAAAKAFERTCDCRAYTALGDLLEDPQVDVVTICTPSGAHLEPALAAIKAGKHVIVEKPLEITLKRCDRIIQAARKEKVVVSTIFPSRFHKSATLMKKAVMGKRFGKLAMGGAIVKWYRSQDYYDSGAWRGTWELDGGGALMNQAIHSVDLLLWLMGPVQSVRAHTAIRAHRRIEVEDVAVATLQFKSGALGTIEATTAAYPGFLKRIEIYGSEGSAVMEEEDITIWDFAKKARGDATILEEMASVTESGGGAGDPSSIGHHGHTAQFRDVLKAIKSGGQPLVNGPEGRRSVELILAIYQAAQTGGTVELPLKRDPRLRK